MHHLLKHISLVPESSILPVGLGCSSKVGWKFKCPLALNMSVLYPWIFYAETLLSGHIKHVYTYIGLSIPEEKMPFGFNASQHLQYVIYPSNTNNTIKKG